jgi:hypothetical protein
MFNRYGEANAYVRKDLATYLGLLKRAPNAASHMQGRKSMYVQKLEVDFAKATVTKGQQTAGLGINRGNPNHSNKVAHKAAD